MSSLDVLIANMASKQFAVISLDQLTKLGATPSAIRSRVRTRPPRSTLAAHVWHRGRPDLTWRTQLQAGLLSLGKGTVVSHSAAAQLHGFDSFDADELEFTLRENRRLKVTQAQVHSTKRCLADRTMVEQFACTTASRTIIDLAGQPISATMLGNTIDSAIRDGLSSPAYLRRRLNALRGSGTAGVRRLDELMIDSGGHSTLERRFLRLMRDSSLPRPRTQVIHRRSGSTLTRVDFEFDPLPLVVEVSGRRGHVTEVDRRRDARRRNELQRDGFVVLEFTTVDVVDNGEHVVDTVREHIHRLASRASA